MKIMLAEDDINILKMEGRLLREDHHTIVQAMDASQVLPMALREKPDLILLDISMPGGNGLDLLVRLKRSALTAGIPVLVVSGSQDANVRNRCMEEGAQGFILKPWNPTTFVEDLKKLTPNVNW